MKRLLQQIFHLGWETPCASRSNKCLGLNLNVDDQPRRSEQLRPSDSFEIAEEMVRQAQQGLAARVWNKNQDSKILAQLDEDLKMLEVPGLNHSVCDICG
jgi:hypothetical protein